MRVTIELLNRAQAIIFLRCKIQQQRHVRLLEYTYTTEFCKQYNSYLKVNGTKESSWSVYVKTAMHDIHRFKQTSYVFQVKPSPA